MDVSATQRHEETDETSNRRVDVSERWVWSIDEVAALLGISRAHAYDLVARDELSHLRLGRRIIVPKIAFDELLRSTDRRSTPVSRLHDEPGKGSGYAGPPRTSPMMSADLRSHSGRLST